ncbi:MAG: acetyl-CoA carboxylase carboxyltransferase subunit beta [Alphaproteobacteria bacterium]|nr:acetyl-CoA carboxylase carboxyltransferase subunit beta [Alphaproteobacteria bacterium]MBP7758025.1 acetyl-CoA carboxylase carboxyltransferase subunit beta [Alphaproteobacteria bacterium]MBP7761352.1 acetyl-CoA carboxylase carboxyltransferase subunit beta [Alphaproteobacteria bacterium]MBP7904864.1 acetyl-CoA carboxylase carboxyltransferase subunit beta [Alphaproteobacteria bacterium]
MNWLTNIIPPRIRSIVGEQKEVPDNFWAKCPSCEKMLFHTDLGANYNVCHYCNHHLRLPVKDRLAMLYDEGKYAVIETPKVELDPLKFKDKERYIDRMKRSQAKTGLRDAITLSKGTVGGLDVVIAAFNFSFMGGSMGMAVGEAIVKAAEEAVRSKCAFIVIPASGGARMQEGMLSLIQMPRTMVAVEMVKEARLPYIVILTDPTTGGVSASFAMVGDIHIAEPGAQIGFAGPNVIKETVREKLPEGFQTAEYLLAHGMVDMIVPRKDMRNTLATLIGILMQKSYTKDPKKNGKKDDGETDAKGGGSLGEKGASKDQVTKARANDNEGVTASQALQQVRAASAAVKKLGRSVTEKVQGTVQGQAAASPPAPESEKKAVEQK